MTPFFSQVNLLRYEDHLEISEVNPIIDYFLSFNDIRENYVLLAKEDVESFRSLLESELEKNTIIKVSKDTGVFYCKK